MIEAHGHLNIKIEKAELLKWLKIVYDKSEIYDLKQAIVLAKHSVTDDEDREAIHAIGMLYRAQLGGTLIPPVSLTVMYKELVEQIEGEKK